MKATTSSILTTASRLKPPKEPPPLVRNPSPENLLPMGSTIEDENCSVTINGANIDGDYVIMAENAANLAPDPGKQNILVNITATLKADIPNGSRPMADVEYVATDGTTSNPYDEIVALDSAFENTASVYQGGSIACDLIVEAPVETAAEGVLSARPERFGARDFVALK